MKLSETSATIATRCTLVSSGKVSGIVGVTAGARITGTSIVFLESKSDGIDDGVVKCSVNVVPREVERCPADKKGFERNCFTLDGTQFTDFGDSPFNALQMTKLSD